jgi:dihydrofolate reductase
MRLSIIVAMDDNQLIGKNNALPWHLPADLAYFKKTTMGKSIIMGRKTYDSIGKPLPNRNNIILSRKKNTKIPHCKVAKNIDNVRELCKLEDEVMIIGGESIYEQFLNPSLENSNLFKNESILLIDRLYITRVKGDFKGDAHFPVFDKEQFIEVSRKSHKADESNSHAYDFIILDRK